jgi:hypothetical protein
VVAFRVGAATPGGSLSGASATQFVASPTFDTHGGYDGASNYTIPVSGFYEINGAVSVTGAEATDQFLTLAAYVGASLRIVGTSRIQNAGLTSSPVTVKGMVYCNAGDIVTLRTNTNIGTPAFASLGPEYNFFEVRRLSGPSVIAASEVVEATYQSTAGNSMTNGTEMFLDFPTKIRDTHGAVSGTGTGNKTVSNAGWKFTAPITGRYYVNAVFHVTSGAVANSVTYGYIAVNGSAKSHSDIKAGQNPVGDAFGSQINGEVFMNAGDYLEVVGYQANGANRNQQAVGIRNQVEIVRVGAY